MEQSSIYQQIAQRTDGNVYLSVVGPVRTGKSTFIKRFMEELVIPNIENVYQRERARDELPQSGSGRTIMTAEPKFVPEEAVEISPDGVSKLSVRLIDSVGYMVEGAMGATEDGQPRMVTTPWLDHEIPMTEAAELGTKKVMEDHCTAGIVITTDGSVTDIPRGGLPGCRDPLDPGYAGNGKTVFSPGELHKSAVGTGSEPLSGDCTAVSCDLSGGQLPGDGSGTDSADSAGNAL